MPRPRLDGTPARREANRRKLSDAFVRTVKPDPDRVVVHWDTLQRGLALVVQRSGHAAFKCVYSIRGRGPRWFHIGDARAVSLADARRLAARIMYQVAEGGDPHADRAALRGKGTFEQVHTRYLAEWAMKRNKSWEQGAKLVRRYLTPRWAKMSMGSIKRSDVRSALAVITAPILQNQIRAAGSAVFTWAVKEEIVDANPFARMENNPTADRERVLSDSEISLFWPHLSPQLRAMLLTGQRGGEVVAMRGEHVKDDWWQMPGAPVPSLNWPGTKNGRDHRIWLSEPIRLMMPDLIERARGRSDNRLADEMRSICDQLGVTDRVTPHDLRRTFCSKVTGLGFGRDAMNRVTNHKEGGIADVYDRHGYEVENKNVMESVARSILALAEGGAPSNVVELGARLR
jgi:integrase